jgi:molecular chaperone GrpE (heat shock protein)
MPTTVEPSPFVAASPPAGGLESPPAGDSLSAEQLKQLLGESLQSLLQPVSDSQKALQEQFAARIRSDEVQAKALETLHDDLKQYKANFVRQQMLPLLKEVIFCHDFVAAQVSRAAGEAQGESSPAASALAATRQMLLDLLFKYDVEPYQGESEMFDPKIQQCARTVPTGRAEADKTIAGRTQTGFRSPDGIVRREQVTVYKFTPGAE